MQVGREETQEEINIKEQDPMQQGKTSLLRTLEIMTGT
jgi:hypothetical protein